MKRILCVIVSTLAVLLLFAGGCSVARRLDRRDVSAVLSHTPRALRVDARPEATATADTIEIRESAAADFGLTPVTVTRENGEETYHIEIEEIVVVAPARSLPERLGAVTVDFTVRLPAELSGADRRVVITPVLHREDGREPLGNIVLSGELFGRVQKSNTWQYARYLTLFQPDSVQAAQAYRRFVHHTPVTDVRADYPAHRNGEATYRFTQRIPTASAGRRLRLTLEGCVEALDGSRYPLPPSDTLVYHISSLLTFADTTARYVRHTFPVCSGNDALYPPQDALTTVTPDTLYRRGTELLMSKKYIQALELLMPYGDLNTAVCLLSLGNDRRACELLQRLPPDDARVCYLLAIAYARLREEDKAFDAYQRACALDENLEYRAALDPELHSLIKNR